jgi:hypothetical protein
LGSSGAACGSASGRSRSRVVVIWLSWCGGRTLRWPVIGKLSL